METYQGQITEFVNWITGIDKRSNLNVTNGLPVSGLSIRELLQNHLLKPFIKYDDVSGGQYIFFSSEEAKNEWLTLTDPQNAKYDLEKASTIPITSMARPSDTMIDVKSIDLTGSEGDIGDSRYIISGDINAEASKIRYIVRMFKEQGGQQQSTIDAFTVTYNIKTAAGNEIKVVEDYNSSMVTQSGEPKIITFPCYSYLKEGTNTINLTVSAKNSAAVFSINISVYLIKFKIESSFDFSKSIQDNGIIYIPVTITRSVSGMTMNIYAQIADGNAVNKVFTTVSSPQTNSLDNPYTTTLEIQNVYGSNNQNSDHIVHTLRLFATLGSGGSSAQFTSNIIYFNFETASSAENIVNKFINLKYDTSANKDYISTNGNVILYATQYEPFTLNWSYYTDHLNIDNSINVQWYLRYKDGNEYKEMLVGTGIGSKGTISDPFTFIPEISQTQEDGASLIAKYVKNNQEIEIDSFPIIIAESTYDIQETSDAVLKLQAFGKTNQSDSKNIWIDSIGGATTTFNNVTWDDRSGWNNNALQLQGTGVTAVINYCPLPTSFNLERYGSTIEIDFMPVKASSESDVLVRIGDAVTGHIDIKPTGAYLYLGNNTDAIVHTNYKVGERIKLAFVLNNESNIYSNGLAYIINNGILERAGEMGTVSALQSDNGNITIGGTDSIVKVYGIRIYNKALTYQQELNNYIFDSLDKTTLISRNQLFKNEQLDYDLVSNKIDTILIEGLAGTSEQGQAYGGLSKIFSVSGNDDEKKGSQTTVNIRRTCIADDTKQFYVTKAMIRKHGQSTINYPITSLKFWFNKSATDGDNPSFAELPDSQRALNLNKNRYVMKNRAIPANKFVLQANYADSSGVHNGGLLRLINDTWYSALFDGVYRLRTAPQLFTSGYTINHNNQNLGESGWIEGEYNLISGQNGYDENKVGKTWPQITGKEFPYKIRTAADSFPCAVFYNDPAGDGNTHFLGQYVFMDDKKSDFLYGERSIYSFADNTDPFVMNIDNTKNGINGKQDVAVNKVWDNKNVLQIEIVLPNTLVTSYMSMEVPTTMELNDQGDIVNTGGTYVDCREIKYDAQGNPVKYYWEDYFEMIYPDPDDIEDGKFSQDSEFNQKAQPFLNFLDWITGIAALNTNPQNQQYTNGTVNETALNRFKREAADHLDLYKLAAYYVFFLRFGLVDSVERNAEMKTYDGQHWHYEPWDMDIAMGNTNQGALVLNPPLDRNSVIPGTSTYAFSGRGASTSNFLWDCLEAWDEWANTLVPEVAEALYNAGLTYENASQMFDEEYSNKWAESLYNEAGFFKYIKNGGGGYLPWLQGSRMSHRHWWLSTSMNYYDSKWSCGTFKSGRVVLFVEKGQNLPGTDLLTIKPTSTTYFELTSSGGGSSIEKKIATPAQPAVFDISANTFSAKDPTWIFGGLFIEELDLSCFARTMSAIEVNKCYDNVLGATIKSLNIGIPLTTVSATEKTGAVSGTSLRFTASFEQNGETIDALSELVTLNVTGQSTIKNTIGLFVNEDRSSIRNFYASGTALTEFQNAPSGNVFDNLVLPATTTLINQDNSQNTSNLTTFSMHNAQWSNIEFWNTLATSTATIALDEHGDPIYIQENGEDIPVYNPAGATYTKVNGIPASITTVIFDGSTARHECSLTFLLGWIDSIKKTLNSYDNGSYDSDELHDALKTKQFRAENINWNTTFTTRLTYSDLENIAYLNGVSPITGAFNNNIYKYIKGYVVLNETLTPEQIVNIKTWFGSSAFDKSGINSQLVVDSVSESVIINIDGVEINNGVMELQEGHTASMSGTKFLLRDSVGNNIVATDDMLSIDPGENEYIWSIGATTNPVWRNTYQSCTLVYSENDGRMQLIAEEGDYGNYDVQVRVAYLGDDNMIRYSYITVHIIGTIYPTGYDISVTGSSLRQFYSGNTVKQQYFSNYAMFNSETPPVYVLYSSGQEIKLDIIPQGTYNAVIKDVGFNIIRISNTSSITSGFISTPSSSAENITGEDDVSGNILYSSTYGADHKLKLTAPSTMPSNIVTYQVIMRVKAGARAYQQKAINIMVIDDSNAVIRADSNNGLYASLMTKYNNDYGLSVNTNLYKTTLIGIEGNVSILSENNTKALTTSLQTNLSNLPENSVNSVFLYLPNITGFDFTGCSNLAGNANQFVFTNCPNLTTLSVKDCTSLIGTMDLTNAPQLTSLDMRGTTLNINIPADSNPLNNSRLTTLKLGTPTSVVINSPTVLNADGVTIDSSANLATITLLGVNQSGPCGYTLFNKLYNI